MRWNLKKVLNKNEWIINILPGIILSWGLMLMILSYFGLGLRSRFLDKNGIMYPLTLAGTTELILKDEMTVEQEFDAHEKDMNEISVNFSSENLLPDTKILVEVENIETEKMENFELSSNLLHNFKTFKVELGTGLMSQVVGERYVIRYIPKLLGEEKITFYLRDNNWLAEDRLRGLLRIDGVIKEKHLVFKPEFFDEKSSSNYAQATGEIQIFAHRYQDKMVEFVVMVGLSIVLMFFTSWQLVKELSVKQKIWICLGLMILGLGVLSFGRRWW